MSNQDPRLDPRLGAAPDDAVTDDLSAEEHGRGEGVGEAKEVEGLSQGQLVWRRFIRHKGLNWFRRTLGPHAATFGGWIIPS